MFAVISYFPKNSMIFPKTLTLRLILNFWGVFGAFLGNFWELFKRSNLLAAVYPYNFIQTICLPFKDTSEAKDTKKILDIKKRIEETYDKRDAYINSHHVRDFKAVYIGCRCCGSKINKEYLWDNHCPVCKSELRSKTVIETIHAYDKRIAELKKQLREEKSKQKVPIRYAVFYCEYVG